MKIVDIIKTKNGLAFLSKNAGRIVGSNKLEIDLPFDESKDYGVTDFSYKNYVRTLYKTYHSTFRSILDSFYYRTTGKNREMILKIKSRSIPFDGDFLNSELNGDISYMPYNKVQKMDGGSYMKTGRQSITVHKFVAKVFKDSVYTEQEKKDFAELLFSELTMKLTLEILSGEDIGKSYYEVPHTNWANSSCMAHKEEYPPEKFTIYNENCKLGIIKDGDKVVGRFLIWEAVDGKSYEDCLYYKTYSVRSWYLQRVNSEKIRAYSAGNYGSVSVELKRKLSDYKDDEKPNYRDSLSQLSKCGKIISTY